MACPVHIWAPLMGAAVPFARMARMRLQFGFGRRREAPAPREMKRWAPVGESAVRSAATEQTTPPA